jgi:hypothetical protein
MPGPGGNPKHLIKDNRITDCDNGILINYGSMPEMMPYADKVIQGNIVLDGDSTGVGISIGDARKLQVIENKVMGFGFGLFAAYIMADPDPLHIMRNEMWMNEFEDLDIMAMAGTIRVYYNFMDVFTRPVPGPNLYEAANFDSTGAPTP